MMTASATYSFDPASPDSAADPLVLPISKISNEQFLQLVETGCWESGEERVELLEGYIVPMAPPGPEHTDSTIRFARIFSPALASFEIAIQGTMIVGDGQIYLPDLMLLKIKKGGYGGAHIKSEDASLVVESSFSTLSKDRGMKRVAYALAGIQDYWVLDIKQKQLIVHRNPQGEHYRDVKFLTAEETIAPLALPELVIRAAAFFE